jgi:hypothetical protein
MLEAGSWKTDNNMMSLLQIWRVFALHSCRIATGEASVLYLQENQTVTDTPAMTAMLA